MDGEELAYAGAARQAELIRAGEVSSRELVELYLERIERLDPQAQRLHRGARRARARRGDAADARRAAGEPPPLLGVPVAIKDNVDVEGARDQVRHRAATTTRPPTVDGEIVKRLRAAGAVIIGKTTLSELAILPFTETEGWGSTRNPWDPQRSAGGSSGGSAAAVAAGLVGAASATDGGGSIRIPAAFCGLVGLKPQRGRVPIEPHDHWNQLSAAGCVTRTVADTALWLDVVTAGGGDPGGPPAPERSFADAAASGARTAADRDLRATRRGRSCRRMVSDEVRAGLAETEEILRSLGHDVRRHEPSFGLAGNNFVARYLGGIHDDVGEVPHPERLEARTRGFGRLGAAYAGALARRGDPRRGRRRRAKINRSWSDFDVLVTPDRRRDRRSRSVAGRAAARCGRCSGSAASSASRRLEPHRPAGGGDPGRLHAGRAAALGHPGRPPGDEPTLLSLAAQIEAERRWADRRPPLA